MENLFTTTALIGLLQIILLDIVLAGDNAIVIALAARNLPQHLQKKAILWGTAGAIGVRVLMAFLVVWLLSIPYLRIIGALLLLWIGYSLLVKKESEHHIEAKTNLRGAITTIMVADGVMGIDNVIGVVGASQGHLELVVIGMAITVPIIVWGSSIFIKLIERYPAILYVGGGILGWAAGGMLITDPAMSGLESYKMVIEITCVAIVLGTALVVNTLRSRVSTAQEVPVRIK